MPISRAGLLRGPCVVTYGGITFFTQGNAKYVRSTKKFPMMVAGEEIERRVDYTEVALTFIPMCAFINANLAVLYPHTNPRRGASVFGGATDKPVVIHGQDGRKLTIANAYVHKMPSLNPSPGKQPFGEMTLRGIIANNTAVTSAGSIDAETTETYTYPAPTYSDFLTQAWVAAWSTAPWDAIKTPDGIVIDFETSFQDVRNDDVGVMDVLYDKVGAFAKLKPQGITSAQLRAVHNIEVARGASYIGSAHDFTATGADGSVVTLKQTNVEDDSNLTWDAIEDRVGELTFRTTRRVSSGALASIFSVAGAT